MTDGLIIAMIISAILAIIAFKMQNLPVMFVSSVGWAIVSLQTFQQTNEILPMLLILMLAFAQFYLIKKGGVRA